MSIDARNLRKLKSLRGCNPDDTIRRKRGHLGIAVQVDLFDTSAKISAAAQVVNGVQQAAVSASASLLAPI